MFPSLAASAPSQDVLVRLDTIDVGRYALLIHGTKLPFGKIPVAISIPYGCIECVEAKIGSELVITRTSGAVVKVMTDHLVHGDEYIAYILHRLSGSNIE